jgi:hypothetical protein
VCTTYIPTATAEIYNEATGKFTAAGSLSRALAYQSATLLTKRVALVAGGTGYTTTCCVVVNTAEFYTPLSLTLSPSSLHFGFLQVGLTSTTQTVTVSNVSNHSVTFSSITHSGEYNESNNCPSTLPGNRSCTITVRFSPTAAGLRTGAVTLIDNAPGSPQQKIALSGTAGAGALTFTVASLNLGKCYSRLQQHNVARQAPMDASGLLLGRHKFSRHDARSRSRAALPLAAYCPSTNRWQGDDLSTASVPWLDSQNDSNKEKLFTSLNILGSAG